MAAFDPISYINTPRWQQVRLGLDRITALMAKLGNPQDDIAFVHVAGTNGKGSVCAYLASILEASGYKTGLFTSPYIECFEERIRIDGCNIAERDLYDVTLDVRDAANAVEREMGEHPTEFELMCAVALLHFSRQRCDIAVIEVGLGGRLDSTNVITPKVSVITRIGLDHTDILGDTLEKIAGEKAGIIKPGVPVVVYPQSSEVMGVIEKTCEKRGCKLFLPDFANMEISHVSPDGMRNFTFCDRSYRTGLLATYQPFNAALAIEAAGVLADSGWNIALGAAERGIASAKWPGRFEIVCEDPLFIIDGAHNPQGAAELRSSLEDMFRAEDVPADAVFVVGVLADKDYRGMLDALLIGEDALQGGAKQADAFSDGASQGDASQGDAKQAGAFPDAAPQDAAMSLVTDAASARASQTPLFRKATFITYTPGNPRALSSSALAEAITGSANNNLSRAPVRAYACDTPEEATELAISQASSGQTDSSGCRRVIVAFGTLYAIGQIKAALRNLRSDSNKEA